MTLRVVRWSAGGAVLAPACVLTIGVFDGMHLGHQELVRLTVERAGKLGVPAVCLTFYPSPEAVLLGATARYLLLPEERAEAMGRLGVHLVVVTEFSPKLAEMSAADFVTLVTRTLHPLEVCVGEDFALGRGREADARTLARLGRERGFGLNIVPRLRVRGQVVSSTLVRSRLGSGDVAGAAELLGRPYSVSGRVVHGLRRGRPLGFPTANLEVPLEKQVPGDGVYAAFADLEGRRWPAALSIGLRPTFGIHDRSVEAHLLDFDADLHGRELTVHFVDRIRGERRFRGPEELRLQIAADVEATRAILAVQQPVWQR